jgi:L-lactate dehydrogenase complex protein LldE
MKRMLGICDQPRQLLVASGCSLREMEESDRCCGFGGVFSIRMPDVSTAMTAEKLRLATNSGADIVVTADPGCLMQMRQLAGDSRRSFRHLAEVLEEMTR